MITVIKSSFLQHKLTILRNKKTSNTVFRQTMNEASYLIAADVLKHLQFKKITIQTPLKKMQGLTIGQPIILVPILRAGLGLLEGKIKSEEFELGSGVNYSINEVADMFGKDYPKEYIPKRKGEYDKTLCTDTKAHELLGWKPTKNINDYIKDFVNNQK